MAITKTLLQSDAMEGTDLNLSVSRRTFLRSLQQKKYRRQHRRFLIEGIKPVTEAITSSYPLESLYIAEDLAAEYLEFQVLLRGRGVQPTLIKRIEIDRIGTLRAPEGVIAVAELPAPVSFSLTGTDTPAIYLWEINDPGNLGSVLRTALWFGVKRVILSPGSADVYGPKVVRGSMGALFRLSIMEAVEFELLVDEIRKQGLALLAADGSGTDRNPGKTGPSWVLVFGSETHGVPRNILESADRVVGIEKRGYGESLNLGVSVGIILNRLMI